jgi:hypothetical protein
MTIFPAPFAFICASHVSCAASVDVVSDSAKFRITSRKDGIEPVVIAFILGMVIVGDVACAVKGMAAPLEMRLRKALLANWKAFMEFPNKPLSKFKSRNLRIDKVTIFVSSPLKHLPEFVRSQCIHNHEYDFVKWCLWRRTIFQSFILC